MKYTTLAFTRCTVFLCCDKWVSRFLEELEDRIRTTKTPVKEYGVFIYPTSIREEERIREEECESGFYRHNQLRLEAHITEDPEKITVTVSETTFCLSE